MKQAFRSTLIAWATGVIIISITILMTYPSSYPPMDVDGMAKLEMLIMLWVGIVVFPTCLTVAALISRLLTTSSPLWRPGNATAIGAITGPLAMYIWATAFTHQIFIPDYHEMVQMILAGASLLVGAVFAFSYAIYTRNSRNP